MQADEGIHRTCCTRYRSLGCPFLASPSVLARFRLFGFTIRVLLACVAGAKSPLVVRSRLYKWGQFVTLFHPSLGRFEIVFGFPNFQRLFVDLFLQVRGSFSEVGEVGFFSC